MSKSFADTLRRERRRRRMTQVELAAIHGISQSAINRWETGAAKPSEQHWPLLADYLGVGISDLFSMIHDPGDGGPSTSVEMQRQIDELRRDVDMLLASRRNA